MSAAISSMGNIFLSQPLACADPRREPRVHGWCQHPHSLRFLSLKQGDWKLHNWWLTWTALNEPSRCVKTASYSQAKRSVILCIAETIMWMILTPVNIYHALTMDRTLCWAPYVWLLISFSWLYEVGSGRNKARILSQLPTLGPIHVMSLNSHPFDSSNSVTF